MLFAARCPREGAISSGEPQGNFNFIITSSTVLARLETMASPPPRFNDRGVGAEWLMRPSITTLKTSPIECHKTKHFEVFFLLVV